MNSLVKLVSLFRWLVGLLFIFSGFIKANDTVGLGYKLEEYFDVFHLSFLNGGATAIALLLCVLEIVLGALLLFGFRAAQVTRGLLALIIFFTFLTFVSAVFKVVTSCGCFGDAIPLTPWQSFTKDLILLLMIVWLYRYRKAIQPVQVSPRARRQIVFFVVAVPVLFGLYTYNFLPVMDFLPYRIGTSIPESMKLPAGAATDEYLIIYQLKNKKTGETRKMSDKDYLKQEIWKDANWEVTGTPERKLLKKGYEVKIKDLAIADASGTDYTHELIENPYYNLIVVAYDLAAADRDAMGRINALAMNAAERFNVRTVLLTSTPAAAAERYSKKNHLFMETFFADPVPLKSMVRANPGVLLLKNGVIVNKWHYHNLPAFDKLAQAYFSK